MSVGRCALGQGNHIGRKHRNQKAHAQVAHTPAHTVLTAASEQRQYQDKRTYASPLFLLKLEYHKRKRNERRQAGRHHSTRIARENKHVDE